MSGYKADLANVRVGLSHQSRAARHKAKPVLNKERKSDRDSLWVPTRVLIKADAIAHIVSNSDRFGHVAAVNFGAHVERTEAQAKNGEASVHVVNFLGKTTVHKLNKTQVTSSRLGRRKDAPWPGR